MARKKSGIEPRGRFKTRAAFRAWLETHHTSKTELHVHCYKKEHAHRGLGYLEAVDEALCFGWIDGITHRFDEETYLVRFTPRKKSSNWSLANIRKVEALSADGRMTPAGLAAFEARSAARTGVYSFERSQPAALPRALEAEFKRNKRAWQAFQERPPGYRRIAMHWVISAKQDQTRRRRLDVLIECSLQGRPIPPLAPRP